MATAMIRLANTSDLPRLVAMGLRFRNGTTYKQHLGESPEQMAALAEKLIASNGLLVTEREGKVVGMLGFVLYDHFLSGEKTAGEVFWWVEPEYRGEGLKLLRDVEERAREAGAKRMQMIAPTEQVARVYEHMNYEFVESSYQKTL